MLWQARFPKTSGLFVIEDTAEIQLSKPNLVRFEARGPRPDLPAVTIRDLVKMSLRLRPDRILVGEVRGGEAFDLLQALNTGHSGSVSTIHANSAVAGAREICKLRSPVRDRSSRIRQFGAASLSR